MKEASATQISLRNPFNSLRQEGVFAALFSVSSSNESSARVWRRKVYSAKLNWNLETTGTERRAAGKPQSTIDFASGFGLRDELKNSSTI